MSPHADDNRELIAGLYDALGRGDGEAMAACYAPNATFRDPVFGTLSGEQPGNMWRMLAGRSRGLKVQLAENEATETTGRARWVASYTFTPTKRKVVNVGEAEFRFENGLIAEHRDRFSMHKWASQALGPVGILFGWSPPLILGIRYRARRDLARFARRRRLKESDNRDENAPPSS